MVYTVCIIQFVLCLLRTHPSFHECCQRKVIEEISEVLPYIGVAIFSQALVVEAIHLSDLPALVVPAQERDSAREANLQEAPGQRTHCTATKRQNWISIAIF